jgi:hypothetical protein
MPYHRFRSTASGIKDIRVSSSRETLGLASAYRPKTLHPIKEAVNMTRHAVSTAHSDFAPVTFVP